MDKTEQVSSIKDITVNDCFDLIELCPTDNFYCCAYFVFVCFHCLLSDKSPCLLTSTELLSLLQPLLPFVIFAASLSPIEWRLELTVLGSSICINGCFSGYSTDCVFAFILKALVLQIQVGSVC